MTKHDRDLIRACWRWILALTQGRADRALALLDLQHHVARSIKADPRLRQMRQAEKRKMK